MEAIVTNPSDAAATIESAEFYASSHAVQASSDTSGSSVNPAGDVNTTGGSTTVGPLTAADQTLASTFPTGNPTPTEVAAYQAYANQYGSQLLGTQWSASQMSALVQLWDDESGWRPNARNASSGANGIPQELGHAVPASYSTDPETQIQWGLQYIQQVYGTPENALAHENEYHWY
jgi:hypothetical protein